MIDSFYLKRQAHRHISCRQRFWSFFASVIRGENQPLVTCSDILYNGERKKPMKNELAGDIALANGKSQYDTYCKRILANKIILAWILKYVADELEEDEKVIRRILEKL